MCAKVSLGTHIRNTRSIKSSWKNCRLNWMLSVAKRETRLADDVRLLRQEEQERRKNIEKLI
ncbi:hypothetical protein B9M95_18495 [Escherichia coli]|nr:hypothetical protein B9M97_19580 [Escherichia coli]RBW04704.1 hypothetical protein B9M96_20215 [Escherichia coli]RBW13514.1 hypothetical protein B9M94_18575 [Escherichia coli]RBW14805.1 hypothetical protein B9M95_18495 [Escherichia coli]